MGRDNRRRSQPKRRFRQIEGRGGDALETVDDLAHAAQFAIFPVSAAANTFHVESDDPIKEEDDNEIEMGDDDDDDGDGDVVINASIVDAAPNNDDNQDLDDVSESDDNESDDDLAEAIRRMEQASAEEEANPIATTSNPPKTENEVDGYKVPIQELESQLQIQLTVQEGTTKNNGMDISINEVSLAGHIKNYMILDRTVVVESITNSSSQRVGQRPLDEGSLLLVKAPDNANDDKHASKASWIPLGRIFEVFGPVSQPLYTIRLPSPSLKEKKTTSAKKSSKRNPKKTTGGGVDAENDKASTVSNKECNGTIDIDTTGKIPSLNEGNKSTTKNEGVPDPVEKETVAQSQSSLCQTTIEVTSESENINAPSNTLPTSPSSTIVEKSLPIQEKKADESLTKDIALNNDESERSVIDPWAMDGEYAKFLSQNKDIQVYYIQDGAKLIDTGHVLRISGKGCDASNIYDEEILDCNEAYYSDDEKEREAKNKRKGATRKKTQLGNNNNGQQNHQPRPGNFHQQQIQHNASIKFSNTTAVGHHGRSNPPPPPPPPPPQSYGYGQHAASLPRGFHSMTQQNIPHSGFQQASPLYQYPVQSSFHGQVSIPPPPPMPNQPYPYQRNAPPSGPSQPTSSMPPPPPPPRNPNEPPAYQY